VPPAPRISGVYETVLYADDVDATAAFYRDIVGLREIEPPGEGAAAFRVPGGALLLLFDARLSAAPGRFVPSHGATGPGHVAFQLENRELEACGDSLRANGLEIEREISWPLGGRSLYVRDPAGNSVEFVEGEIWDA
jgi:catechol 2,3-dioxygenase-like lactoylglutathione lyase family enzyme